MPDGQPSARPSSAPDVRDDVRLPDAGDAPVDGAVAPSGWADLWQIPTILLSLALITVGVVVAIQRAPQDDFDGALRAVETMLTDGHLDAAGQQLRDVLEPNLAIATTLERARFHRAVADWVALAQEAEEVDREENNQRIAAQYALATELGLALDPSRIVRWGHALIALGRMDDAYRRLMELQIDRENAPGGEELRAMRNDLFRRYVEVGIAGESVDADRLLAMLNEFRTASGTTAADRAWAVGQLAELHLVHDRPQMAIDQLLVDLRDLESRVGDERVNVAGLYTQLGRAYFELGRFEEATFNLEQALTMFESDEPARGDALVTLGRLAMSRGEFERAHDRFDRIVRDFVDTRSFLTALLGRAEVRSILGEHEASLEDYAVLVHRLDDESGDPADIGAVDAARSLVDRHDAALTAGDLRLALRYVELAQRAFTPSTVPADVLIRLATTSRQIADNLVAELKTEIVPPAGDAQQADVADRYEANVLYEQAGEFFVRHARLLTVLPGEDQRWAESLWNGADCFDRAGLYERAIEHFEEYLSGRSRDDPRWAEVNFRLAQAHHATLEYEPAAQYYERVIEAHPRSVVATRSHVPLAQCYLALDRRPEAERQLREVLAGHHPVRPDAMDYRNAVFELGTLYYREGDYAAAVPVLDEAAQRYPNDARYPDLLFQLAESYRQLASDIAERIRPPSAESPGERRRLDELRRDHLRRAYDRFTELATLDEQRGPRDVGPERRSLLRSAALNRADCAYHLGELEHAIELYDQMARRYPDHPASMHALVQIVNAYSELGDAERARMAHRRALARLRQLRDEAFEARDVLMDREAWERWLRNAPVGTQATLTSAGEVG